MISHKELAALNIERAIVHDIPKKLKSGEGTRPQLSDTDSLLDNDTVAHLHQKIVQTLSGTNAYELEFSKTTESPAPAIIRQHTSAKRKPEDFVEQSQRLANYLFELQGGSSSAGRLCVLDCSIAEFRAFCILKVRSEVGTHLTPTKQDGKATVQMSMIRNLVLTTSTKLFKNALFLRTGDSADDFSIIACDEQRAGTDIELARFWSVFLGCELAQAPRIATKRFFELNREYIDTSVRDPIEKAAWWQSTLSELTSHKTKLSPQEFIKDYVPPKYRHPFEQFLREHKALKQFALDTSDIASRLRRISYHTRKGVTISVLADSDANLIKIEANRIVINDAVTSVG